MALRSVVLPDPAQRRWWDLQRAAEWPRSGTYPMGPWRLGLRPVGRCPTLDWVGDACPATRLDRWTGDPSAVCDCSAHLTWIHQRHEGESDVRYLNWWLMGRNRRWLGYNITGRQVELPQEENVVRWRAHVGRGTDIHVVGGFWIRPVPDGDRVDRTDRTRPWHMHTGTHTRSDSRAPANVSNQWPIDSTLDEEGEARKTTSGAPTLD